MESKKHYKLYKSGKKWCCMALTTVAAIAGIAMAQTGHADANNSATTDVQQTVVNSTTDSDNNSSTLNQNTTDNSNANTGTSVNTETVNNNSSVSSETTNSQSNIDLNNNNVTVNSTSSADNSAANTSNSTSVKNGWYNENGQEVYYENGQTKSGEDYVYVQSINNANTKNWYLVNNGVAQSGLQKWAGTYYYFNPTSYLKETNTYQQVNWSNGGSSWYMFGNDGAIVSGLYQQDGTYYYYDPSTYLRVTNNYQQVNWSNGGSSWYMFGNDGKIVTGLYKWYGSYYYFSPNTYEKVTNNYIPVTWSDGGTSWYMFDNDGKIVSGLYSWCGSLYYFSPSTYEKLTNTQVTVNGVTYKLDASGIATAVNNAAAKADKALTMLGVKYVWGGNTPSGFDCSGLVQWAFGLGSNYRTTYQQTTLGTHHYDVTNAPKGALVFFGSDSAPYHVGISLGNGTFVHAPEPGDVVKITKMAYYKPSYYIVLS